MPEILQKPEGILTPVVTDPCISITEPSLFVLKGNGAAEIRLNGAVVGKLDNETLTYQAIAEGEYCVSIEGRCPSASVNLEPIIIITNDVAPQIDVEKSHICDKDTNTWFECIIVYIDGIEDSKTLTDTGIPCSDPPPVDIEFVTKDVKLCNDDGTWSVTHIFDPTDATEPPVPVKSIFINPQGQVVTDPGNLVACAELLQQEQLGCFTTPDGKTIKVVGVFSYDDTTLISVHAVVKESNDPLFAEGSVITDLTGLIPVECECEVPLNCTTATYRRIDPALGGIITVVIGWYGYDIPTLVAGTSKGLTTLAAIDVNITGATLAYVPASYRLLHQIDWFDGIDLLNPVSGEYVRYINSIDTYQDRAYFLVLFEARFSGETSKVELWSAPLDASAPAQLEADLSSVLVEDGLTTPTDVTLYYAGTVDECTGLYYFGNSRLTQLRPDAQQNVRVIDLNNIGAGYTGLDYDTYTGVSFPSGNNDWTFNDQGELVTMVDGKLYLSDGVSNLPITGGIADNLPAYPSGGGVAFVAGEYLFNSAPANINDVVTDDGTVLFTLPETLPTIFIQDLGAKQNYLEYKVLATNTDTGEFFDENGDVVDLIAEGWELVPEGDPLGNCNTITQDFDCKEVG